MLFLRFKVVAQSSPAPNKRPPQRCKVLLKDLREALVKVKVQYEFAPFWCVRYLSVSSVFLSFLTHKLPNFPIFFYLKWDKKAWVFDFVMVVIITLTGYLLCISKKWKILILLYIISYFTFQNYCAVETGPLYFYKMFVTVVKTSYQKSQPKITVTTKTLGTLFLGSHYRKSSHKMSTIF